MSDHANPAALKHRIATAVDLPSLREIMKLSIEQGQSAFLTPEQVTASHGFMGLDTQLVDDGTYFVVEMGGRIAGCGGWSRRATLFGGDHSTALRDARLLDPVTEPARIRAMYTHPDCARRGVGRSILGHCEEAARAEGFARAEMMATLAGEPLYQACGYVMIERTSATVNGVTVPLVRMGKSLLP